MASARTDCRNKPASGFVLLLRSDAGRHQLPDFTAQAGLTACLSFVGDDRQGVIPVPIPNTAVKPLSPMILLSGKVGHCRLYGLCEGNLAESFPFLGLSFAGRLQSVRAGSAVLELNSELPALGPGRGPWAGF